MPIAVHPGNITKGVIDAANWWSNIPMLYPQFTNDSNIKYIYGGTITTDNGINLHNVSENIIREYLVKTIPADVKIFFDDIYEGIFFNMLVEKIHNIIKDTSINPANVYYFSGTVNGDELYKMYCEVHNIIQPINIYYYNHWEYHTRSGTIKDRFNVIKNKEKLFLCFNRMFKIHRYALLGLLLERNLVSQ